MKTAFIKNYYTIFEEVFRDNKRGMITTKNSMENNLKLDVVFEKESTIKFWSFSKQTKLALWVKKST